MNLLQMSLHGAIFILAVVILRIAALHHLPKKTFVILWWMVLLRLLLPFSLPSRLSVHTLISPPPSIISHAPLMAESERAVSGISMVHTVRRAGTLLLVVYFTAVYLHCRRQFSTSLPIGSPALKAYRLRRPISLRQSDQIATPMTYGVLRPVILLPKNMQLKSAEQLDYILMHEYTHIRHFDAAAKLVMAAALCLHWFNPLVWIMALLFNRDIELACDESVIHRFGRDTRAAYSHMLIDLEARRSGLSPFCSGFGKNAIKERITAVMKIKKNTVFSLIVSFLLAAGAVTAFATSAPDVPDFSVSGDVEWWTYDEYSQWLEQEKQILQSLLGTTAYTSTWGDFVWTQERIDEAIAQNEQILQDIKNGLKVSKSVNGSTDVMLISDTPDSFDWECADQIAYAPVYDEENKQRMLHAFVTRQQQADQMNVVEAEVTLFAAESRQP